MVVPKITDSLKNQIKMKDNRNTWFLAFCSSNQGIYSHQFSKLQSSSTDGTADKNKKTLLPETASTD